MKLRANPKFKTYVIIEIKEQNMTEKILAKYVSDKCLESRTYVQNSYNTIRII